MTPVPASAFRCNPKRRAPPQRRASQKGRNTGLFARWFRMKVQRLPSESSIRHATPVRQTTVQNLNFQGTHHAFANSGFKADFVARFEGFINIPRSGKWSFELESDDGSRLLIDNAKVVNNDGLHGMVKRSGSKSLSAGQHNLVVDFFQLGGGAGLILRWSGPGVPKMTPVPASAFRCNPKQTPFRYFDIQSKGGSSSALTYARAKQLCSSQGQRLCSAAELCRNGRPRPGLDKFGRTDNWIAVNNAPNEWITFTRAHNRLCKTHTQIAGSTPAWGTQSNARGQGFKRAAECCF